MVKKIVASIVGVISLIVLVGCLLGIAGVLVASQRTTAFVFGILVPVEDALTTTEQRITRIKTNLATLEEEMNTLETDIGAVAGVDIPAQMLTRLVVTLENELAPAVADVEDSTRTLRDAGVTIAHTVSLLSDVPLLNVEAVDLAPVRRMSSDLSTVQEVVIIVETLTAGRDTERAPRFSAAQLGVYLSSGQSAVSDLRESLTAYETELSNVRADIVELQRTIPFWINVGTAGVVLVLLWLAISQVFVLRQCWVWLRS